MHDPDVAVAALEAPRGGRLLVVDACGGAEAAFAHLAADPCEVRVAALAHVDQVDALVSLQRAAFARLDRTDALKLLGLLRAPRDERAALYARIRRAVNRRAQTFWSDHASAIHAGIYNASAEAGLGRLLRSLLWEHLESSEFRTLLYGTKAERLAVFDARIAPRAFWRRALRLCALRNEVSAPEDPSVDAFTRGEPMAALRKMVAVGLWSSPLWARAFCTDAGMLAALPTYLQPIGFASTAARTERVRGRVERFDQAFDAIGPLDGVDLGALPDHTDDEELTAVLTRVVAHLKPGRRVSYTRIDDADPPPPPGLRRAHEVELRVGAHDRAPMTGARRVLIATGDVPAR